MLAAGGGKSELQVLQEAVRKDLQIAENEAEAENRKATCPAARFDRIVTPKVVTPVEPTISNYEIRPRVSLSLRLACVFSAFPFF